MRIDDIRTVPQMALRFIAPIKTLQHHCTRLVLTIACLAILADGAFCEKWQGAQNGLATLGLHVMCAAMLVLLTILVATVTNVSGSR